MLVAAGLGMAAGHALISLLALNGLRVSEATGADIGRPAPNAAPVRGERRVGHRTGAARRPGADRALVAAHLHGGTTFTTASGQPMTFARGQVWVVLAYRQQRLSPSAHPAGARASQAIIQRLCAKRRRHEAAPGPGRRVSRSAWNRGHGRTTGIDRVIMPGSREGRS